MTEINDAVRDKDKKSEKIPLLFADCEAVEEFASRLIPKHHPHLGSAKIRYICRNVAAKRGGRPVSGNVYKMTGKWHFLTGDTDLVIEVALEVWNGLEPSQRLALVDHLLTRIVGEENEENGDMKYTIVHPEIQEFSEVAERHGQWHDGLVEFEKSLRSK